MAQLHILLVDDEEFFIESIAKLLSESGYFCDSVTTTVQANRLLDTHPYDVVVSDIIMEGNTELEFVSRLSHRVPKPGVILVTGQPSLQNTIRAIDIGVSGFLVKPFEIDELTTRIEEVAHQTEREQMLERARRHIEKVREDVENLQEIMCLSPTHPIGVPESQRADSESATAPWWHENLTRREREVVAALLQGYRVSTVARRLEISPHTVRRHLKSIFLKLEIVSQAELLERLKPWNHDA